MSAIASDLPRVIDTGLRPRNRRLLSLARRKPLAAGAGLVLVVVCVVALFAPVLAPFDPNEVQLGSRLLSPSSEHWLGTDEFGRDVLSRIMHGARVSLAAGLGAAGLGTAAGVVFGLLGGYIGGFVDLAIQRVMDALMALPPIILLMVLATVLSPSLQNVVFAIAIFVMPSASRVVRGAVLAEKEMVYVLAAQSIGASPKRVMVRHVLPNTMAPIIILASIAVGSAIIIEAALGFLGLSVRPPAATWGTMLNTGAQTYMEQAPWLAVAPGLAIGVTVFSINLLGDGLRDILDPRLRGSRG
ncbi:MAG: ABC transporter permease [Dehalococcoidia bacterium]|nr:ABC transporter permease [Dehalococcoidia bacterium]MCA9844566.1 ABC transporter permease [Dehalococcoidia bacterium]MCA9852412.1 ABC transporter permease [Dehalococcoidia bacterium]